MSDWVKKCLGDISDSCLGKMLDKAKNKGIYQPYLANLNVKWGEFKIDSLQEMRFEKNEDERYGLKNGDLVICEGGEPGRCAIWRNDAVPMKIQKALHRLRVHSNYDSDFLFYRMLLAGKNKELDRHFIGSTIKHLTGIGLKGVEFEFPQLSQQKRISTVLRTIDKKIELNNKINIELEAMAKLIYDYWFVQFDFPDANGKPYKLSGGKMVYNEALKREIPERWGADYIENLLAKESRTQKLPKTEYLDEGLIPVIDQSTDFICGYTNDESTLISTNEPRIVFGDHTRILKLIDFDFARGADGTQVLLSNNANVPQHYFYHSLLRIDLSNYGYARHFKFLKQTRVVIPEYELVTKYEEMAKNIYGKIKHNIFETKQLEKLRDWLLPMLMNGQVTVKDT